MKQTTMPQFAVTIDMIRGLGSTFPELIIFEYENCDTEVFVETQWLGDTTSQDLLDLATYLQVDAADIEARLVHLKVNTDD